MIATLRDPQPRSPARLLAWFVAPVAVVFAAIWSRLPQDDPPTYFAFVDGRSWLGIANAWNVLSNLPFVAVAWLAWRALGRDVDPAYAAAGRWLAVGSLLTALGSAYFHWAPSPQTLFWDRLPMTLTFAAVALLLVSDRFAAQLGNKLALPLPLTAAATVLVWRFGGTLRPYLALQFGLMLWTLLVALLRPARRVGGAALGGMLGLYALAKVLEAADGEVDQALGGVVAGHALKHLVAALALAVLVRGISRPASHPGQAART